MSHILELKTVKDLAKIFDETDIGSAYRYDAIKLIKKWRNESGLKKDKETDLLLDELLKKYSKDYLSE